MEQKQSQLRVWLYYRLSRDDDPEKDSLTNQKNLLPDFAEKEGFIVAGESFDDNLSGMHFDKRTGIDTLMDVAKLGRIDAVLVKDLSRFGRHRLLAPLYREQLKAYGVRVLSATESLDTFNESDDLMIGFKDLINDAYARDISRKIRAGFKQKQKNGLVLLPPFGYIKKDRDEIEICEECAQIVRLIFKLYIDGFGVRKITLYLTENNYKTPSYYQHIFYGKKIPYTATEMGKSCVWSDRSVTSILKNEAYAGVLYCAKTSKSTINRTRKNIPKNEWIRHENYYPKIISEEDFALVQSEQSSRRANNVRAKCNTKIYRYAGLLRCRECHGSFTSKNRKELGYVEYVCNSYARLGTKYCSSHRIRETILDDIFYERICQFRHIASKHWDKIDMILHQYSTEGSQLRTSIANMDKQIKKLESELVNALDMVLRFPDRAQIYEALASERESRIVKIKEQKLFMSETEKIKSNAAAVYQNAIQIFDQIIESRSIDDAHLRLIIDSIVIGANSDGSLDVDISLKAPFLNSIKDVDTIDDLASFIDVSKYDVSKWRSPDMQSWEEVKNAFML